MSDEEEVSYAALKAEYDALEEAHDEADELPDEVDRRLGEIETAMETLQNRPVRFEPEDLAIAGAFVSIDGAGRLRVERGYVRPEDEPVAATDEATAADAIGSEVGEVDGEAGDAVSDAPDAEDEEEDGLKPLSDRLVCELTAHRTLALRNALANDPQTAFLAALHAMALRVFYHYGQESCVEIEARSASFGAQAPGLGETAYAEAIARRIERWAAALPKRAEDLWDALTEFDGDSRDALFAHCVAMTVNAVHEPYNRRPRALAHAGVLAATVGLDMAKAGWRPTADSYLGRVTKARILEAAREAKSEKAADRIAGLKKPDMVAAAEELLAGTGWLPEVLRTPALAIDEAPEFEIVDDADDGAPEVEAPSADNDGETAMGDSETSAEDEEVAHAAFA